MDKTTLPKKSSLKGRILIGLVLSFPYIGLGGDGKPLPAMTTAGLIPLQTQGDLARLEEPLAKLATAFSSAVSVSKRFNMISDELVRQMWQAPGSRMDLVKEYEIEVFTYLNVLIQADNIQMVARLVNPNFDLLLQESESILKSDFIIYDDSKMLEICKNLFFRLINRLPIDVTVTSIQGPFITLSGGLNQGLTEGQLVDLIEASVKNVHPATGSWQEFSITPVAKAQIIELTAKASIAKLVSQEKENGLKIGDGAKSPQLPSRNYFTSTAHERLELEKSKEKPILVGPLSIENKQYHDEKVVEKSDEHPIQELEVKNEVVTEKAETGSEVPTANTSKKEDADLLAGAKTNLKFSQFQFGLEGDVEVGSEFFWLLPANYAQLSFDKESTDNFFYAADIGLGYGYTPGGHFLVYDLGLSASKRYPVTQWAEFIDYWQANTSILLSSLSVTDHSFSTFVLEPGAGLSVGGRFAMGQNPLAWQTSLDFYPLAIGTASFGNHSEALKIGLDLAYDFDVKVWQDNDCHCIKWGLGLGSSIRNFDTEKGSAHLSTYQIYLLANDVF